MDFPLVFRRKLVIVAELERQVTVEIGDSWKRAPFENDRRATLVPSTQISLILRRRWEREDAHPARRFVIAFLDERIVPRKNLLARHTAHEPEHQPFPHAFVRNPADLAPEEFPNHVTFQAVPLPPRRMHRDVVEREDIDENALFVRHMRLMLAQERRPFAAELSVSPSIPRRVRVILEIETARIKLRLASAPERFIFRPQKRNIGIIVPRDESPMAHGAEQRACDDIVMDTAFLANAIGFREQFKLYSLKLSQLLLREINHASDTPLL